MIGHAQFEVAPWELRESTIDLDVLAQTESVFALSNGHIGLRANLDEGEPSAVPGTYLNGYHELRPLPHAEAAYGQPESGQTMVNVTNGKVLRLLVDDEPFDIRYGQLRSHERVLDFRSGLLTRRVEWCSPAGQIVRVTSTRLVSLVQRSVAAIQYEVEAVEESSRLVIQSELVANEPTPERKGDPRAAAALRAPLVAELAAAAEARAVLVHTTTASALRMAAAMDHIVEGAEVGIASEADVDLGRVTITADLPVGEKLRVIKFLGYGWSSRRTTPAVRDQVEAAVAEARHTGWDGLVAGQRGFLDEFWDRADVAIEGDAELQQAVRFALFQILQAGARAECMPIPAKGLTGPGYDGHTFWDTETYVLPVLTYTAPAAAADALRYRHSTLEQARDRAHQLGLRGAAFPWRTIDGQECSGYWPAGTAAFHVTADIAAAVSRYEAATGDELFTREVGFELLVHSARLWRSLGHHDAGGRFRIDGVTGPDEYSALADNNIYTNLAARQNLLSAASAAERFPEAAVRHKVDEEEAASWRDAAEAVIVPYDESLEVHQQAEGFTDYAHWDFQRYGPEMYPLLLHAPYFELYRKQVVKQADLVLALHLFGDRFSAEQKLRDYDYYEAITVRDSSLSACTQGIIAAEVGHLDLAYDYYAEAALMDLKDRMHNTRDGLHLAALAGAWLGAVAGFGGMRDHDGKISFAPRLPGGLDRISFRIAYRGRRLHVRVAQQRATYTLLEGEPLETSHHGEEVTVAAGDPVELPIPRPPRLEPPSQPPGRAPLPRAHARGSPR